MALHVLSARQVNTASIGDHADGGGLFLRVSATGSSWVLRFTAPDSRRREMGLGPAMRSTLAAAGESVAMARKAADKARALLAEGIDPIERRKADREAAQAETQARKVTQKAERTTLARVARRYHEEVIEPQRTAKHAAQWIASLEQNVPADLWHAPIDTIEAAPLLDALAALRKRVPETSDRVRQRLETVFDEAIFHKLCTTNPARVIRKKLAERPKGKPAGKFKALPFADVPAFTAALRRQPGTAARMLEFALLTASRTGEVLGATWGEVDIQAALWRIPGQRMKGGEDHTVYLSPRALEIIETMRELQGSPWVFPSLADCEKPMSNMAMLTVLRRMGLEKETTVHGVCRASFSTWANETGAARPDVIEACLAHREADKVRASYNRASFAAERRQLLLAWAAYCSGEKPQAEAAPTRPATVIQLDRKRADERPESAAA